MSAFGTSRQFKLTQATDGTLTLASQEAGVTAGITGSLAGILDGGLTGSVGLSHTLVSVGVPVVAAVVQKKVSEGVWGLPYMKSE